MSDVKEPKQEEAPRAAEETQTNNSKPVAAARRRPSRRKVAGIVAVVVVVCLLAGFGGAQIDSFLARNNSPLAGHETLKNDGNKTVTQEESDIANVVKKVSPSVVSVLTKTQSRSSFFGAREQEGAGTGIIVSKDGYVLTNKHVIDGANTVSVVLTDGTSYDSVKVLGSDPLNDVAFLKIPDVNNLTPAELGDSTSIQVGHKVVAIGNSLGQYQNTVTSGIISGTGRPISAQSGESVEN